MQNIFLEIQTALANKVPFCMNSNTIMTTDVKKDLYNLRIFKELTIKPVDDTLNFSGDFIDLNFTEEEFKKIQKANAMNLYKKTIADSIEIPDEIIDHIEEQIAITLEEQEEQEEYKYHEILVDECDNPDIIVLVNYMKFLGLTLSIEENSINYIVSAEKEEVKYNHFQLLELEQATIKSNCDAFNILAKYNYEDENDEKCYGIRFVWEFIKK